MSSENTDRPAAPRGKRTGLVVRAGISIGLLAVIAATQVDFARLWTVLAGASLALLLVALGMRFVGILISAARWRSMLGYQGLRPPLRFLLDSYMVGAFFNTFMPTSFGGDVIRIMDLQHWSRSVGRSVSSVFMERVLGIVILVAFAVIAMISFPLSIAQEVPAVPIGIAAAATGLVALFIAVRTGLGDRVLERLPKNKITDKLARGWGNFRTGAGQLMRFGPALGTGLGYSLMLQLNVVVHYWIIGMALGLGIPLVDYFFLIPILIFALMLPAINGVGVREATAILLFSAYGVPAEAAVAFGLVDLGLTLATGAIGGLRFALRRSPAAAVQDARP